jgi:tRNA pseudouridine38-40 synthase
VADNRNDTPGAAAVSAHNCCSLQGSATTRQAARRARWEDERVRLRLDLAYDGGEFHGWAAQPGLRTVQGTVEAALGMVLRQERVAVTCAGRTDTGVHARGQVAHLDVPEDAVAAAAGRVRGEPAEALARRLNAVLPDDVRVRRASVAPEGFDARFSAVWRRYAYRIADRPEGVDPLERRHVLSWPRPLDVPAANAAGAALVGEHDFAAFCKGREGASTVRRLLELSLTRHAEGTLTATVRADAFCHHMVRSLLGCLVAVGEHRRPPGWAAEVLAAGRRDPAVTVLPAHGLTLEEVAYPPNDELATRATQTRRVRADG